MTIFPDEEEVVEVVVVGFLVATETTDEIPCREESLPFLTLIWIRPRTITRVDSLPAFAVSLAVAATTAVPDPHDNSNNSSSNLA